MPALARFVSGNFQAAPAGEPVNDVLQERLGPDRRGCDAQGKNLVLGRLKAMNGQQLKFTRAVSSCTNQTTCCRCRTRKHGADNVSCNAQGKNLVLGGLKAMNGQLEFFGVDDMEPYRAAEHFMCTNIEWDPTGRYVATSVTSIHQMENGFNIWLFNGTPLYRSAAAHPMSEKDRSLDHPQLSAELLARD